VSFKYYQFTGKRRTAGFGWQYEFGRDEITKASDIPEFLLPLRERAGKLFEIDSDTLAQASIVDIPWERLSAGTGTSHSLGPSLVYLLVPLAG
jgi:hypothetical protein